MLYTTPALDTTDRRVLEEIDSMRGTLRHQIQSMPLKWQHGLRQALTADAIAGSNSIEGYRVDSRDVEDLLDGERDVDTSEENKAETLAYQQMMTYIQSLHDATDFSYSKWQLNALHWMLQGHHGARKAGQWRRGTMYVTDPANPRIAAYTAPDADRIPYLMTEVVDWLNEGDLDQPPLIRAAMAHLNLVKVHPWPDGNGRMSRSLQTLLIAREGVLSPEFSSIEEWLGRPGNTWEYYKVLADVGGPVYSPDRDTRPWIRFNLLAYHQQAQTVRHRVDTSSESWMRLTEYAEPRGLVERQVTALHDVAVAGRVRRSRYQRAEALSAKQAQRDLQELTEAKLLEAVGRTRGRYYVPGDSFPTTVLETARAMLTLTNPYQD